MTDAIEGSPKRSCECFDRQHTASIPDLKFSRNLSPEICQYPVSERFGPITNSFRFRTIFHDLLDAGHGGAG